MSSPVQPYWDSTRHTAHKMLPGSQNLDVQDTGKSLELVNAGFYIDDEVSKAICHKDIKSGLGMASEKNNNAYKFHAYNLHPRQECHMTKALSSSYKLYFRPLFHFFHHYFLTICSFHSLTLFYSFLLKKHHIFLHFMLYNFFVSFISFLIINFILFFFILFSFTLFNSCTRIPCHKMGLPSLYLFTYKLTFTLFILVSHHNMSAFQMQSSVHDIFLNAYGAINDLL